MIKYYTLFHLKKSKELKKTVKKIRKGLSRFRSFMFATYQNLQFFQINKTLVGRAYIFVLLIIFAFQFGFPRYSSYANLSIREAVSEVQSVIYNNLPSAQDREFRTILVTATAYNSLPGQTDDTPCLTANQYDLCANNREDVIACNFLPFGTRVMFPDLEPNKIYTVQDRMHQRYPFRIDFWLKEKSDAKKFGLKTLRMQIYE